MTTSASSFTALSRDNLIRLVGAADFFTRNSALAHLATDVAGCRAAYLQSKKNSSCSCGGNVKLLTPCFEALLTTLEGMKTTDPAAVATFVNYVTSMPVGNQRVNVSVYYTKNNGATPHRYEFKA